MALAPNRRLIAILVALLVSVALLQQAAGFDFDRIEQLALQKYGNDGAKAIRNWRTGIGSVAQDAADTEKLRVMNNFFNIRVRFSDDQSIWGQSDYWATPLESLVKAAGDCEDFAIAKYISLKQLGIAPEKLRLTYVKARIGGPGSNLTQAHMILAYYATPDAEPLILDNLINDIRPASRRNDLTPVFSFNSEGLWVAGGPPEPQSGGTSRLSRWQDLLLRMQAEGFQ